jgi:hypothetical protein
MGETKREKIDRLEIKIWEILDHLGEPRPSFRRDNSNGRAGKFSESEWMARRGRVSATIQMKLNDPAPQTNSHTHSVTNLAAETARYGSANYKMKISNFVSKSPTFTDSASIYSHLKISQNLPILSDSPGSVND